jgi:cob(I)alamin adenosyltransferase
MALDNLISVSFTSDELKRIDTAMSEIENILTGKVINLTPKQRQLYGRVAYEMEVWVDKVQHYMQQAPQLVPPYIDMTEHTADLEAHRALNPRIERLATVLQSMKDTNLLLGTDIYNNSVVFHRSLREASKANAVGASTIYADLKQQFNGGRKPAGKKEE